MNDENELLEPLATEAGQEAIVRAIRDISSLEYAVRAEQAASTASAKAGEASQSAIEASEAEDNAKDWATKTDGYVEQETITISPEQEGEEPTTETINLYSARYYAALAQDAYNNMQFDSVPTENSTNMVNSGTVYSALDLKADKSTTYTKTETDNLINTRLAELVASAPAALDTLQELATALGNDPNFATTIATQLGNKADKSDTYTKTEVDTALSNVQSTLTFDNVPTANSDNPVKSSGIKTALDGKQDTLTFDSTPTANSTNPVTSGGVYTALASKADSSSVPTKVSDLTNDSGFITGVAWNDVTSKPTFATVATSGSYSDLSNTPTIPTVPTNVSDFTNDAGYITGVSWSDVTSKPTFATVATSGSYTDLDDKPTMPPEYTLPTASVNTLGGIKVGTNLSIDNDGVLSASGGGNVTVDSTITENSLNPVTSAAIYAALLNLPSGGGSGSGDSITVDQNITINSQNPVSSYGLYECFLDILNVEEALVDDNLYYCDTADEVLLVRREVNVYKKYNTPAIGGIYRLNDAWGHAHYHLLLLSLSEDGADMYSNNGSDIDTGTYVDSVRNITWYYKSMSTNGWSGSGNTFYVPLINNGDATNSLTKSQIIALLLQEANPTVDNTAFVSVDTTVTQNSNNLVTSGAVYSALQNAGGGSSVTVDSSITQGGTNPVEGGAIYTALGNKADKSTTYTKTEVDTAISSKGDVTTNTDQNITGTKTFVGSKKVAFKQSATNDKLGFTLYGNTGTERGYLEFNPTNTVDGVTGLMTLGNYATSAAALTQVGFRRYSNISGASGAYNLLMPMVADARTPFSLTTTYTNFYLPLGFTDGTTTVKTAKSGLVDLSPLLASLEARIAALEGN